MAGPVETARPRGESVWRIRLAMRILITGGAGFVGSSLCEYYKQDDPRHLVVAFDNLSGLRPWLADAICRLATGGGFATRELYTDDSEVLFNAQRPVILNGIDTIAEREDLRDRSLILTLPVLTDGDYRAESEFWEEFERDRPLILGALLDAVSHALAQLPQTTLRGPVPRMADFAKWVTAAEGALGWDPGTFLAAYLDNRKESVVLSVEFNPVAMGFDPVVFSDSSIFDGPARPVALVTDASPSDRQQLAYQQLDVAILDYAAFRQAHQIADGHALDVCLLWTWLSAGTMVDVPSSS